MDENTSTTLTDRDNDSITATKTSDGRVYLRIWDTDGNSRAVDLTPAQWAELASL